jgi:hypothetical protein
VLSPVRLERRARRRVRRDLKGSYWAKDGRLSDVLSVARGAARSQGDDTTAGFVSLVEKAAALSGRSKMEKSGEKP